MAVGAAAARVVSPTRIAVVRALPGLGDLLCAVPALTALRAAHPTGEVTLVGLPSASWFVDAHPALLDDLLPVVGVPGLPEVEPDPPAARRFHAFAAERGFDLALQLHGSGVTTNPLTTMLGARDQVCAHVAGHWLPPGTVVPYPDEGPEVHRLLAVTTAAGAPTVATVVRWWVDGIDREEAEALLGGRALAAVPYVCVHPGASRNDNRWPAADFAAVGDRLAASGCRVVLTGSRAEAALTRQVAGAMTAPAVDLGGETTVRTLAAVFAGARLVVSNDTGAAHLAAAVRAPSVVVFPAAGDPERWAPLDRERHRVVVPASPAERWPTVPAVVDAASRQLAARHRTRRGRDGPVTLELR